MKHEELNDKPEAQVPRAIVVDAAGTTFMYEVLNTKQSPERGDEADAED